MWWWSYESADGGEVTPAGGDRPRSQDFPTQSDAETWIGETWRELLDSGVAAVSLYEHDRRAYGPMGLSPH